MYFGTVICEGGWILRVVFFVMWVSVCMGVAYSMDIVCGIQFSLMSITWLFTDMPVKDPVVCDSSLLYRGCALLSFKLIVSGKNLIKDCYSNAKLVCVRTFSSKYRLYLEFFFVEVCNTLSCLAATWWKILWHRTFGIVALAASSGGVDGLTTASGTGARLDRVKLNAVLLFEQWTWQMYAYVSLWIIISRCCWFLAVYIQGRHIKVLLYLPTCPFVYI